MWVLIDQLLDVLLNQFDKVSGIRGQICLTGAIKYYKTDLYSYEIVSQSIVNQSTLYI